MPKGAQLTSIDSFVKDPLFGWQADRDSCRRAVEKALIKFGREDKLLDWFLYPITSSRAFTEWTHGFIQLLYIDGDHSEQGVNTDFNLWTTKMESGSVLLLHDSRRLDGFPDAQYAQGWRYPTALANQLRTDVGWALVNEAYSLTVWRKL